MSSPYLAGLQLQGREVVVVGAGAVAQRRLPALLEVGARVTVIAPEARPAIEGMAEAGELTWLRREFQSGDLAEAWYVMAATNVAAVNTAVGAEAMAQRTFCVRADAADQGSAITPATGAQAGVKIAVASQQRDAASRASYDPGRLAKIRDGIVTCLADGRLAGVDAATQVSLGETWGPQQPSPGSGHVVLVGGGPGDPDLITVRGRRMLALADVVVADRLGPRALLNELAPNAEIVDAAKLPRGRFMHQDVINQHLIDHAKAGKFVVRLKGGDCYVFGRGWEEVEAVAKAGIGVSVVPGISSSAGVPALAGVPLTHRGAAHEAVVVSGHVSPDNPSSLVNWPALAQLQGTLVVLMGMQTMPEIVATLVHHGRPPTTPVAVIADGSMPHERRLFGTLATIVEQVREAKVGAPAVYVIGKVAGLSEELRESLS